MTLTSDDFENLGERTQALIRKIGIRAFAERTGLSQNTARRFLRDPQAIMRSRGGSGILAIIALRADSQDQAV